jgi:hypothetical protein
MIFEVCKYIFISPIIGIKVNTRWTSHDIATRVMVVNQPWSPLFPLHIQLSLWSVLLIPFLFLISITVYEFKQKYQLDMWSSWPNNWLDHKISLNKKGQFFSVKAWALQNKIFILFMSFWFKFLIIFSASDIPWILLLASTNGLALKACISHLSWFLTTSFLKLSVPITFFLVWHKFLFICSCESF